MIMKAFAIYDTKSLAFGMPFFMQSAGAAVRAFGDLAGDPQSSISKHPSDYVLYEIGSFDDSTASFVGTNPHSLGFASDYLSVVRPAISDKPGIVDTCDKVKSVEVLK